MLNITLKGGDVRPVEEGTTVEALCRDISMGLFRNACAARVNNKVVDLRTALTADATVEILTFDDQDGKKAFWHTASHIMAQAVQHLYPDTKFAIGPSIDNGFYYDFDVETPFTMDDLAKIEAEMAKIVKENLTLERLDVDVPVAEDMMKDQPYKLELLAEHAGKGEKITFYRQGDFTDLCAGPHLMSTGAVKAVKLTSSTGAYWRGDEKKKMLCRIYGIAFPKKSELTAYLEAVEEAKKRDHNKIGREMELFTTVDIIGQGLPVLLPKGARIVQLLQRWIEDEEQKRGYLLTKTPYIAKSDLYKISGHWDHYQDSMFIIGDEKKDKEVFALRPMTCPFQYQVFLNRARSYRDLPMRLGETSTLFRKEASGEMHGLIRVRQFTISEGHIICTPEQLEDEFRGCLDLARYVLGVLGLEGDITYRFSKWDPEDKEKYIGTPEEWDYAQNLMRGILNDFKIDYTEAVGEAAFYGPKLDIQIRNVYGKEDTLVTIQVDLMLAKRFGMEYTTAEGTKRHPYILHRTSLGCYERTLALLIEKYAGAFPLWLAPEQVRILPITDRSADFAKKVKETLVNVGMRVDVDSRNEKIGYKIREAQVDKIPYMLVIGDREAEAGSVSVRSRKEGDLGVMSLDDFMGRALKEIAEKAR